jgi:NADPH-dependent glutamate synthase beta subunit-like oxidoreductase/ferredoxin
MGRGYRVVVPDLIHWQKQVKCQAACPIHTDSGRYVQLIAEGKYKEAYLVARSPNPFASVCGRVCAAPCEDFCRRGNIDEPVTIRALKRFVTEKFGPESMNPDTQDELFYKVHNFKDNKLFWHLPTLARTRRANVKGKKVAIIGAGPAGLTCAHDLAIIGYRVTIFEYSNVLGGMMRHGIPEFRLARSIIEKEIGKIIELGVEIRTMNPLTKNFGIKELREEEGFDAIFIAVGTQEGREINVEGADMDGIIKAIDFLINVNNGYRVSLGRKVLVIGGGFVAFDAARTALRSAIVEEGGIGNGSSYVAIDAARSARRAGVMEVHMASLESFEEMPVLRTAQGREEFEEALKEGIIFHTRRGVRRFIGENGRLKGVEFMGVKRTYDEEGRFDPVFDENISEYIEADTVILAIGQRPKLNFIKLEDGIELTSSGMIKVDPETLETSTPGVFAGGDVAFGPRNLIDAIADGKQAAISIDNYLRGLHSKRVFKLSFEKIQKRDYSTYIGYEILPRRAPDTIPIDRRTGVVEVEMSYSERQAQEQARRCLLCHIQTIYDAEKCVLCGACVDVCPEYCLKLVPIDEIDIDEDTKNMILSHYNLQEDGELTAMIKEDERCIRCGLCAIICPTDAITMERMHYVEEEVIED